MPSPSNISNGALFPFAGVALMGLWWTVWPQGAIRFYERCSNKQFAWLGEGMVRSLGVLVIVVSLVGAALVAAGLATSDPYPAFAG